MSDLTATSSEEVYDLLNVLVDDLCRSVLSYFVRQSTEVARVQDLADVVRDRREVDATPTEARLHHVTLPRLAELGVLDYDARSNTARYRAQPKVEAWVNRVVERREASDVPA